MNTHVKNKSPTCYGSKFMTKVKVFPQTERQTDKQTGQKLYVAESERFLGHKNVFGTSLQIINVMQINSIEVELTRKYYDSYMHVL